MTKTKRTYVPPDSVVAPKKHFTLVSVLDDNGPGNDALALCLWNGEPEPYLALRTNGTDTNPLGNPQSRGMATWFRMPHRMTEALLSTLPKEKQEQARLLLNGLRQGRQGVEV